MTVTLAVEQLASLVGGCRYDAAPQEVADILASGAYREDDLGSLYLPDFYDYEAREYGQCGEIAIKDARNLRSWVDTVNGGLSEGRSLLQIYLMEGSAPGLFSSERSNHVWVGLGPVGAAMQDLLVVDGSLREISTTGERDYRPTQAVETPAVVERPVAGELQIGTCFYKRDGSLVWSSEGYINDAVREQAEGFLRAMQDLRIEVDAVRVKQLKQKRRVSI